MCIQLYQCKVYILRAGLSRLFERLADLPCCRVDSRVSLCYDKIYERWLTAVKGEVDVTLDKLEIGDSAVIDTVGGQGALRRRFLDMGLTPGTKVQMRKKAPMGDPIDIKLRGYELTLRLEDAEKITLKG